MSVPVIRGVQWGPWGTPGAPLLVLGPSLGTTADALWAPCAAHLAHRFRVLAWDLPGHGRSRPPAEPFTMAELADAVIDLVTVMGDGTGATAGFAYAGDSVGGSVGLELLLNHPDRVTSAVLLCTAASFGPPQGWHERAATVRASGTPSMVEHSARVWFGPDFLQRHPERGAALLHGLQDADAAGYAAVCEALADFDVRDRLGEITAPVLTIAGALDTSAPPAALRAIADGVADGRAIVLDGVAHLAPIEEPERVAREILQHVDGALRQRDVREAGMTVRRQVLGDEHVDRAGCAAFELTAEFQDLITRYAWGTIWTRPGLDRRTRSLLTITALVARGHHEELALHLRAAVRGGVTVAEIRETLLQAAIYCGVPDANTAFRIAAGVLAEPAGAHRAPGPLRGTGGEAP